MTHNLQIQSYSFDELLELLDIRSYDFSIEDLKRAKKKVLMLHPDKSRLGPEYFLFYKKALEIVVQFYDNQNRQNQVMNEDTTKYRPENADKTTNKQITKMIGKMSTEDFQDKFNQLFESNQMAERPDPTRNEWFRSETPGLMTPENTKNMNSKNMGQVFDTLKQQNAGLVQYRGVQNMMVSSAGASQLYGDYSDIDNGSYITSDPFSKLKFDDLRKVHKDQTVFAVSESDFSKVKQYSSVDHFQRERNKESMGPLDKAEAERILADQERIIRQNIMKKEYEAKKQTLEYEAKNSSILGTFLRLGN